jgi:HD-GYP domain-containing protein (c-di-GMP phosphodiesterase class II)
MENKKQGHLLELNVGSELAHGICVSNLAYHVGEEMGLPSETCHELAIAGLVHDIGKLELAKYLYSRTKDPLTVEELKYVRTHSTMGYVILNQRNYSDFVLQSILHHHENYDGSGYPSNLSGEEIPIGARILRVCDTFAALISDRPYRKAFELEEAVKMMIEEIKDFDVGVFLAFQRVIHGPYIEEIIKVNQEKFQLDEEEM